MQVPRRCQWLRHDHDHSQQWQLQSLRVDQPRACALDWHLRAGEPDLRRERQIISSAQHGAGRTLRFRRRPAFGRAQIRWHGCRMGHQRRWTNERARRAQRCHRGLGWRLSHPGTQIQRHGRRMGIEFLRANKHSCRPKQCRRDLGRQGTQPRAQVRRHGHRMGLKLRRPEQCSRRAQRHRRHLGWRKSQHGAQVRWHRRRLGRWLLQLRHATRRTH